MIKLALHSISYAGFFYEGGALPVEEIIARAARFGYEGLEIMAKRPICSPFDFDTKRATSLRKHAEKHGIDLCFLGGYIDLPKPVPSDREKELVFARESFRLASDLGTPYVRMYAGGEKIHWEAKEWDLWNWSVQGLKELLPYAEKYGVKMALEVHTGIAQTVDALLDMLEQTGSEDIMVCLDPPLLAIHGEPAYDAVKKVGKKIVHGHVADFKSGAPLVEYETVPGLAVRRVERLIQVPLGEGMVEIEPFMKGCYELGIDAAMAFEVCTPFHIAHKMPTLADVDRLVEQSAVYLKELRKKVETECGL